MSADETPRDNVDDLMTDYRECVRHIWNTYFFGRAHEENMALDEITSKAFDEINAFDQVAARLFQLIVLARAGLDDDWWIDIGSSLTSEPLASVRITARHDFESLHALVNRTAPPSGYWDDYVTELAMSDVELRFLGWFDWDRFAPRDYRFCRVRIVASSRHPQIVGRDALIESSECRFELVATEGPT